MSLKSGTINYGDNILHKVSQSLNFAQDDIRIQPDWKLNHSATQNVAPKLHVCYSICKFLFKGNVVIGYS